MSLVETGTASTEGEDIPRSAPPGVHTALRDPNLQIRLLRLHGGPKIDGISASLEVWDRGSKPRYRAISYVCGPPDRMQDVTVNGTRISVRHNCYYALWQTRLHFPQSRVWIDAICINQLDLEEKAAQVMMMSETYTTAARVLVCIGPSDAHSDVVMQATEDIDAFIHRIPWDRKERSTNADVWHPPLDEAAAAHPPDETAAAQFLVHYNEFSMRTYFTRVWVLQELAAGRSHALVLCGKGTTRWLDLAELSLRLYVAHLRGRESPDKLYKRYFSSRIPDMDSSTSISKKPGYPFCLQELLELQCQDVRDRIYSTSVLIDWGSFGQSPPVPDYQISPLELALQLVSKMVDTRLDDIEHIIKTLDLLNPSTISQVLEELRTRRLDTRCSQVPDVSDRKWSTWILGAQMVEPDLLGRPSAQNGSLIITFGNPLDLSGETTAESELPSHWHETRTGDILVESTYFELVLRPHDDGNKFVVVSDVLPPGIVPLAEKAPFAAQCDCYLRLSQTSGRSGQIVHIAIELSDQEALAAVINYGAASISREAADISPVTMSIDGYGLSGYSRSAAFAKPKVGSHVWDVTAEAMKFEYGAEMGQPPCAEHRAGDYYWKYQKFLWYSVLMGTGTVLP
jgi:hypothetical protein